MIRSPNIWDAPDTYELENLAADRAGVVDAAIARVHPLAGADVVDVGCGSGFHLPRLAAAGARVVGVEPHLPLVRRARERMTSLAARHTAGSTATATAVVAAGAAEALPFADRSVDLVHARYAYFFGAGCEPGLAEAERVLRPGGVVVVVDVDATRSTFGSWFRRGYPGYDPAAVQRFWDRQGFTTEQLDIEWTFDRRADLEAVIGIELPPAVADDVLADHRDATLDVAVVLRCRTRGAGPRMSVTARIGPAAMQPRHIIGPAGSSSTGPIARGRHAAGPLLQCHRERRESRCRPPAER
ncbi:MAG: class I SAM-dependent methyltransferase [Dermatophilaceae bacterium]